MKKFISISILSVAVLFSLSAEAKTIQMEVIDVQPVVRNVAVNVPVNFQEEVCYRYKVNSRGVLEKIVDNGFGSQERTLSHPFLWFHPLLLLSKTAQATKGKIKLVNIF